MPRMFKVKGEFRMVKVFMIVKVGITLNGRVRVNLPCSRLGLF